MESAPAAAKAGAVGGCPRHRRCAERIGRRRLSRRYRPGLARPIPRQSQSAGTGAWPMTSRSLAPGRDILASFTSALATGAIRIIDLTQTLSPDFPSIVMPPAIGQSRAFRMEEISRYDERGGAWYWNNLSVGEHTGTHFDAPIHW